MLAAATGIGASALGLGGGVVGAGGQTARLNARRAPPSQQAEGTPPAFDSGGRGSAAARAAAARVGGPLQPLPKVAAGAPPPPGLVMSPVMSPDWQSMLRSVGLTHAHQQSEEAVRGEEALQAARTVAAPPPPSPPQQQQPQPSLPAPPLPATLETELCLLWGGGFGDDGPERRRKCVVRAERANPALRYVERKGKRSPEGKRPSEAAATALAPAVATRTAATPPQFPSLAGLGGRNKTQAAAGVEPWVPVAANVRDGQVAALYSGLAKCEGGKAVLAAAARARAANVQ